MKPSASSRRLSATAVLFGAPILVSACDNDVVGTTEGTYELISLRGLTPPTLVRVQDDGDSIYIVASRLAVESSTAELRERFEFRHGGTPQPFTQTFHGTWSREDNDLDVRFDIDGETVRYDYLVDGEFLLRGTADGSLRYRRSDS